MSQDTFDADGGTPEQKPPAADAGKPPVGGGDLTHEERQWGMFAHLFGLLAGVFLGLGFLGPLIVWLVKKDESPFVDDQGKEALNFQLTMLGLYLITGALVAVTCGTLFFLPLIPWALTLIFGILATVKSNQGVAYRYPICVRLLN